MTNHSQEHAGYGTDQDNVQMNNNVQDQEEQSVDGISAGEVHMPREADEVESTATVQDDSVAVDENRIGNKDETPAVQQEEILQDEEVSGTGSVQTTKESPDLTLYGREELVEYLRELVEQNDFDTLKNEVDAIKFQFYRKLKNENEQKRLAYVENGGAESEYVYEEDANELILKNLLNKYRELRNVQNEQLETEKQKNLEEKLQIIEELKELVNNTESIGGTFQAFRDLQSRWRSIGLVPQSEVKNLWETYHHHVEIFYDYIKINKELRDLDFKRNLEMKLELCEKAERLLLDPSVINAFHTLQAYHDQWREIGPVPQEMRVEIWERFKAASTQVNRKHQEHFENLKEAQKKNLEAKEALYAKVEEIILQPMNSMAQWEKSAKEIIEAQKFWNTIGGIPRKDNSRVYRQFHHLCDKFFNQKRDFFSKEKEDQENNLQLKEDLCVQAEAIKDSTEWKPATEEMINLQKRWKEIGSVPAKHRNSIWKRFRSACDYFFEQKNKHFSSVDSEYDKNLKAKQELIDRVRTFSHTNDAEADFEQLKEFQRQWSELGYVPIKYKKKIQEEYREAINKQFDALRLNDSERNRLRYRNKIEHMKTAPQSRNKIDSEREKLIRKYQQIQGDLVVWENNIGFFSKSKNSEAMIANVQRMIEQGRSEIREIEEKIKMIDTME